ncbi:hypothetical protein ACP70R_006118 [Stipagrostis hirtigluma subsp. patula]
METEEKRRGKEAAALSGGHLCHVCGYQYPNPNPSAKLRRSHRKHCGKVSPAAAAGEAVAEVGEREEASVERNAPEAMLVGREGGEVLEGNGASEVNGGSALLGSAKEAGESLEGKVNAEHDSPNVTGLQAIASESSENGMIGCINSENASPDDTGVQVITSEFSGNGLVNCTSNSVESVNEGNGTELLTASTNGSHNKVAKYCSGVAPVVVLNPAEREDSYDEYQDASPFLHQSDSEDGAAPNSDIFMEINNSKTVSSESGVAANEISLETNGLCKYTFSKEPSLTESPVNVDNNYTDTIGSKSDKASSSCELIGDSSPSSLQQSHTLIIDPDSQSTCCRNVEGSVEDSMCLHTMSEVSPKPQVEGCVVSETITGSSTSTVPTGNDLKVGNTENITTECSMGLSLQNCPVEGTSDVQLPIDNSWQEGPVCSAGFQEDVPVTNVDGMLKFNAEDSYNDLDFTFHDMSQQDDVKQIVDRAGENPSGEKTNGFSKEEVCNKQIDPEVLTEDQFSTSQKHAALLMDQKYSVENSFNLDDAKNDELFELPTNRCCLEIPTAVESSQEVDSTSPIVDQPTVADQPSMAEAQHCLIMNEHILSAASASENGPAVDPEDMPVSSSAKPVKNTCLSDAPVDDGMQEAELHTSGISFVPSDVVATMEFSTVSKDMGAPSTDVEENVQSEDTTRKEMIAVHRTVNAEKKQTENTTPKDTYGDEVEEKKLAEHIATEMSAVQHADDIENNKQAGAHGTEEVSEVWSIGNVEEKKQAEDPSAKEMNAEFTAEGRQTDQTTAKKMDAVRETDHSEEKMLVQDTSAKEMNSAASTDKVDEKNQANGVVGQESNKQNEEIAVSTGARLNSGRIHVPLKVLLAEASVENKVKKTSSTKERVLSFRRRLTKDDNSSAKSGSPKDGSGDHYWNSPARLPRKDIDKRSKGRKQPWMPFICCHSVH